MELAIATRGLTKVYHRKFFRRVPGIVDLALEVRRGEVFGYLGPNGSGKTTTMRCLVDVLRPTAGTVRVLGRDPRRDGPRLRRSVGYLPGELAFDPHLTGDELLRWFAHLRRVPCPDRDVLAERLGLDVGRPVRALSKGNRQKLGLVQALMHRPRLALLDEPATGLDPLVREEFFRIVEEGRENGRTFLLSSHAMDVVERLADRVGIVRDGQLVRVGPLDELRRRPTARYEVRFRLAARPADFAGLAGVRCLELDGRRARFEIDGSAEGLFEAARPFGVERVESEGPDLGRAFLSYYGVAPRASRRGAQASGEPKRGGHAA